MRFVALLRGINVSGQKKILMKDLRELVSTSSMIENVQTYIQSGNIIFNSENSIQELKAEIYTYIYKEYNFEVPTQVLSLEEWGSIFLNNPFLPENELHINRLYGTFLDDYPSEQNISKLEEFDFSSDKFIIKGKFIYTYYHNGAGRSKMTNNIFENKLNVSTTSRNWKTITRIYELLSN